MNICNLAQIMLTLIPFHGYMVSKFGLKCLLLIFIFFFIQSGTVNLGASELMPKKTGQTFLTLHSLFDFFNFAVHETLTNHANCNYY